MTPPNPKIVLIACGAFNPPTNMHLRMFELARDQLHRGGKEVVGGIVSPVHDSYGKKELASSTHRCEMLKLALESSNWIRLSTWETQQEQWTRTRLTLQYHQNQLNSLINDNSNNDTSNKRQRTDDMNWVPDDLKFNTHETVHVKLLCGADLLESFGTPGLWADDDISAIVGQHGLVVITREGSNPYKFIYESDMLTKYQHNIIIVTEWITNDVSSTKIRRALRRNESVKYLIQEPVIDYITRHALYGTKTNIKYLFPANQSQTFFLTPSPSDVNMESPSPTAVQFDLTQNVKNFEMFGAPLIGSKIGSPFIKIERIDNVDGTQTINEETAKRSSVSYPGQAVQVIKNANGESEIYIPKVRTDERESTVANVQIQITKDGIKVISDRETTV